MELPEQYPYKSPSIGFKNRIFHPNIDEASGSVCLDVINQSWSSMFSTKYFDKIIDRFVMVDLLNVLEGFLPQLLRYPNPADPLNSEAAALLSREPKAYEAKVKEYVRRYASKEAREKAGDGVDEEAESSGVSSVEVFSEDDAYGMEL